MGASGNVVAASDSLLLCYWTLGYGKTAMNRYEHIVAYKFYAALSPRPTSELLNVSTLDDS